MSTTLIGRMSTFGGPDDPLVSPSEDLALVFNQLTFSKVTEFFLPEQPPGTTGFARRLNPKKHYIACRWNYADTPKSYLLSTLVKVTNPKTGKSAMAKPLDWGPRGDLNRTADLSPGLAEHLGLETNEVCEMLLLHPGEQAEAEGIAVTASEHLTVLSESAVRAEFGDFKHKESTTRKGAIVISPPWATENIVKVEIPQLKGLPNYGNGGFSGKLECHKKIAKPLQDAFEAVEQQGHVDLLKFWGGCWVPRHKSWNPERGLSSHSWAIAFDINVQWNGYDAEPAAKGKEGSVVELVPIFESFGFAWGGFFGTKDGMHFEYCKRD